MVDTQNVLIPKRLIPGSTIGIISPSSAVAVSCPRRFARGVEELRRCGYEVNIGRFATTESSIRYTTGSPIDRADDLNAMFADSHVDAIMTCIGGYSANQLLDYIDFDLIQRNPKLFVGYSDTTVLHAALWSKIHLTVVTGPALLPQFGEYHGLHPFTANVFRRVVVDARPAGTLPVSPMWVSEFHRWDENDDCPRTESPNSGPVALRRGSAIGRLIPMNIESLRVLIGTEWFPDLRDVILCLEAAAVTNAAAFHQLMTQLNHIGVFHQVRGLAFGRFHPQSSCSFKTLLMIVEDTVPNIDIPIAAQFDFGHTDPMLSLPWGVEAKLDVSSHQPSLALLEAAVKDNTV